MAGGTATAEFPGGGLGLLHRGSLLERGWEAETQQRVTLDTLRQQPLRALDSLPTPSLQVTATLPCNPSYRARTRQSSATATASSG